MPENQIPATQPEPGAEPGEFNFAKPASETPRIKRRSLKTKSAGLIKASGATPTAARDLEREAPPLPPEQAQKARPRLAELAAGSAKPTAKPPSAMVAPPRTTPSVASTMARELASASAEARAAAPAANSTPSPATTTTAPSPSIRSTATPSTSPHGTRPATLYYSSPTRKAETPAPSPMKTIPTVSPAASAATATAPSPASASSTTTRPTTSASRPTAPVDYRANVERQSREQKSVGNILFYFVWGLLALFVIGAGLAAYGANVIFAKLHDQSETVTELDAHYSAANKDLTAKLAATQDALTQAQAQAQAQFTRQQDLIVKQQEEINKLINAVNDDSSAIKSERQNRAQETANLRARVRELEDKAAQQKF